jgi:hypothetical protein
MRKVIRIKREAVSAARTARAGLMELADANLARIQKESKEPVYWKCPLTGMKVYYK